MDGENNGKPYEQMDDLEVFPYFWKHLGTFIPNSHSPIPTSLLMCASDQDQRELERPCILQFQVPESSHPLPRISKPAIMFRISAHIFFKCSLFKKPHEPIFLKNTVSQKKKNHAKPTTDRITPLSLEDKLDL